MADVAAGGEVVLTGSTRSACADIADPAWRELDSRPLKNVSRDVRLVAATALPAPPPTLRARTLSPVI